MKKIVVMGSSMAGIKAIEEIREQDPSAEITLFTLEGHRPYDPYLLADFVSGDIPQDRVYYQSEKYYQQMRVAFSDAQISRVNLKRKQITTEDKETVHYDELIITDTGVDKFPDIKGTNKSGILALRRLRDISRLITMLPLVETIVIQAGGLPGLEMAVALKKRNKEAIRIVPGKENLPAEDGDMQMIEDNAVAEVLGDSEVKAVRLKSGKVIACQAVIFGDTQTDIKLFRDCGLQIPNRISVNEHFQTGIEGVFALNGVCESA